MLVQEGAKRWREGESGRKQWHRGSGGWLFCQLMGREELVWVGGGDRVRSGRAHLLHCTQLAPHPPPLHTHTHHHTHLATHPCLEASLYEDGCRVDGWSSAYGDTPGAPNAWNVWGPGWRQQVRHSTSSQLVGRRRCAAPQYLCGTAHSGEGAHWQQFPSQGLSGRV